MEPLIRISEVEKYYGSKNNLTKALNKVSFTIQEQEFVGIMGASGSGKTTLLNMLSTIDTVTSGHIYVEDTDITTLGDREVAEFRKEKLGFVFQDFNLLDTLTIEENILLPMNLLGKNPQESRTQAKEMMAKLGIGKIADKFPYEVSGGQKQRCACARAIINQPKLILADEPTGALDSKSATMLLETFTHLNQEFNATILLVTHDAFSASYCQRILFLRDGALFHELYRGDKSQREYLNEILDVLALTAGGVAHAE